MQNKNNPMLMYSIFSGTFYEIPDSDFHLMDGGQIPLLKKPSSSCSKCYGRGHLGRDTQSFGYTVCNCVRKVANINLLKTVKDVTIS